MAAQLQKVPVEITFAVRDMRGYVPGTEVSALLRQLSMVEYSYYLGFPVRQIAERESTHSLLFDYINTLPKQLIYSINVMNAA